MIFIFTVRFVPYTSPCRFWGSLIRGGGLNALVKSWKNAFVKPIISWFDGFQPLNTENFCKDMAKHQWAGLVKFHAISIIHVKLWIVFCWVLFVVGTFFLWKKNVIFHAHFNTICHFHVCDTREIFTHGIVSFTDSF